MQSYDAHWRNLEFNQKKKKNDVHWENLLYNEILQLKREHAMSSLVIQIKEDIMFARRAKDAKTLGSLQLLLGEAEKLGKAALREATDEEVIRIVKKSIENNNICLTQGASETLTEKLTFENQLIVKYLPQQLSDEELKKIINEIIKEKSITQVGQVGQVMGELNKRYAGKFNGALASSLVKESIIQ
jgi:uncharacterized protein YqeY